MIDMEDWASLCPSIRVIDMADKSGLYHQGDACHDAYVVARGHIKLSRVSPAGSEHTIIILPAGDICGAGLVDMPPHQALDTATAKGRTRLYRMPCQQLRAAVCADARVGEFVLGRLARRQAFLERRVEHLLGGDVCDRLVSILVDLAGAYGGHCAHGHEIDIRLTQQELAEMTGATRPTVSSMLNRLRALGLVSYTRHYICIESLARLARVCSDDLLVG